jgi:WD40 repeat protein
MAFSPTSALLALAQEDGAAILWGIADSRVLGTVRANHRGLQAIAFSGDGRMLATGGTDGRVRVWDLEQVLDTGTRVGPGEPDRKPGPLKSCPRESTVPPRE